ncbi:uncharacterized protein LOC109856166 [Pseudomyrmex gracilis]|uniref:uncharacterized protein LOC109856166 n=1 Tax=Pseudomyrmex gracilis TaxID=219809 RepID=UPI000994AF19|nr:uncharacterized protein LOC109856166 [Pseudomyrmex gracilis]
MYAYNIRVRKLRFQSPFLNASSVSFASAMVNAEATRNRSTKTLGFVYTRYQRSAIHAEWDLSKRDDRRLLFDTKIFIPVCSRAVFCQLIHLHRWTCFDTEHAR